MHNSIAPKIESEPQEFIEHPSSVSADSKKDSSSLDWKNRPSLLSDEIDLAFNNCRQQHSLWGLFNGDEDYKMFDVSHVTLMKQRIRDSYPLRKEFYFLDIGAGDFRSILHLSEQLNSDLSLPKDIVVHCIGVRGESHTNKALQQGVCRVYTLGEFKIDCMEQAFQDLGFEWQDKIDIIVSRWTFRHLADPVGAFLQAYAMLRPGSGLMIIDAWYFAIGKELTNSNANMRWLLLQTGDPFLIKPYNLDRSGNRFALLKSDKKSTLTLPLQYQSVTKVGKAFLVGSNTIVSFEPTMEIKNVSPAKGYNKDIDQEITVTLTETAFDEEPEKQYYAPLPLHPLLPRLVSILFRGLSVSYNPNIEELSSLSPKESLISYPKHSTLTPNRPGTPIAQSNISYILESNDNRLPIKQTSLYKSSEVFFPSSASTADEENVEKFNRLRNG